MELPLNPKLKQSALCTYGIVTQTVGMPEREGGEIEEQMREKETDREKKGEQFFFWYDKLRKYSESKGLQLIFAVMHQFGCRFVGGDKVFMFSIVVCKYLGTP